MSCTGLLGGTLNPPHNGHVLLAETARKRFDLDPLRVHVSTNPPHKRVDVPVQTRLELTRLAFPGGIVVRDDHPYSIDTVLGYGDAAIAQDKLAEDVVILDMRPVCIYTDFFVVCSGRNPRQVRAIWDDVRDRMKHDGERLLPRSVDGERESSWIVGDYLDVVLHVFTPETRA